MMAPIDGLSRVVAALRAKASKVQTGNVSVIVGFTASYALYVHENLQAYHPVGQAKFLEQPLRENREVYARLAREAIGRGRTVGQALVIAGLQLQRDAQQRTPVDTGNLKASAFTRLIPG